MKWLQIFAVTMISAVAVSAQQVPAGTVLPVMLNSTLDAGKVTPGQKISGRTMQEVRLPDGFRIPARSRVSGHIVEVSGGGPGSRLVLRIDQLTARGQSVSLTTSVRAIASMSEVFEAQLPTNNFDEYGTSIADWTTVQVGGDAVYRGNGTVISPGNQVVGSATIGGDVTARLMAVPGLGCRGPFDGDDRPQALWVFSTSACGAYGFRDLRIAHAGRTNPLGEIVLESPTTVLVRGGSGWLLRVNSPTSFSATAR